MDGVNTILVRTYGRVMACASRIRRLILCISEQAKHEATSLLPVSWLANCVPTNAFELSKLSVSLLL